MQENKSSLFKTILWVVALLFVGVGSFVGGTLYQKGKQPATAAANTLSTQGNGNSGFGQRLMRGGAAGQVSAVSSTSISINTPDGTSKQYAITSSTEVTDSGQTSSVSNIAVGDTVLIIADSNDSSTATRIIRNPQMGGSQGSGGPVMMQSN